MKDSKAILIVDDDAILLLSIRQELRLRFDGNFIYETALSAELGLKAIDRLEAEGTIVSMVISDWLMPGMSGDEFLSVVHETRPEIKLVLLSGHSDKAEMERLAGRAGLFTYMMKPYKSGSLSEMVERALAKD